jgi:hypothetical protein
MRKMFFFSLLLLLSVTSFGQQTNPSLSLTKLDYLQKSRNQKTIAYVLAGGGSIAWLAGLGKYMNQDDNIDGGGEAAMIIGGTAALASIPFFIISSKSKKNAMSVSFKNQLLPRIHETGFTYTPLPSLSLKISL